MNSGTYFSSKMAVTQITEGLHSELLSRPEAKHIVLHNLHPNAAKTQIWFSQRNRPAELEHAGTAQTKAAEDEMGTNMNERIERTGGLTAADVINQLFAGMHRGDLYIKAATESQGGQEKINAGIRRRMEAQISGKAPEGPWWVSSAELMQEEQEEGVAVKKHARAIPCATWEARNANSDRDAAMSPHDNAMSSAATIAKIFSGSFRIIMPITERVTS